MRTSKRAALQVEGVESRALLSGVPTLAPLIYPPPVQVRGHVEGTAIVRQNIPDVGDMYVIQGVGRTSPMGNVLVRGQLQTTSFSGKPIGTVTLSNRLGSVELKVTDSPSRNTFDFEVSSATGRYAKLQGTKGVMELKVDPVGAGGRARFQMDLNRITIL